MPALAWELPVQWFKGSARGHREGKCLSLWGDTGHGGEWHLSWSLEDLRCWRGGWGTDQDNRTCKGR